MRKIKRLIAVAVMAVMTVSITGCKMIAKTPEAIQKTVVATVAGDKITIADLDKELRTDIDNLKAQYGDDFEQKIDDETKEQLKQARTQILEQVVNDRVIIKKGEELKVLPSGDELAKEVEEEKKMFIEAWGGEDQYASALSYFGMTEESFNTYVENLVKQQKVFDDVTKDVTVTDEEAKKYYDDNISSYTTKPGADARHILFKSDDDATAKADAEAAKAKIDSGETTFEDLFNQYSGNKANNVYPISEDLGFVEYDKAGYDTAFLDGLKPLKEGEISAPIKSSFGYHIIEATNVTTESKVTPFDDVKDAIKTQLLNNKKQELFNNDLETWKKEYDVKIYEDRL